jgi:hypothetical protein
VSSKILDCADVRTCGMLSVITALEFFQHYFSEMGHRDLLVTQNLSQAIKQPTISYLTRSVRRRAATSKRANRTGGNGQFYTWAHLYLRAIRGSHKGIQT